MQGYGKADRARHDTRVVPYSGRAQPPLPATAPQHLSVALQTARQDPRAQLSQALKFVQAGLASHNNSVRIVCP